MYTQEGQIDAKFDLKRIVYLNSKEWRKKLDQVDLRKDFLGSLLGTHWSAIGQFFPVPENFGKLNSAQFPLGFLTGKLQSWIRTYTPAK